MTPGRVARLRVLLALLVVLALNASYAISAPTLAIADSGTLLGGPTEHQVSVAVVCYALTLGHTGSGADPVAFPINSPGCPAGEYELREDITLSGASPDTGWAISGWTGTADDSSTASTNSLTMPASDHSAGVTYLRLLGDVNVDGLADSTDALIILSADVGVNTSGFCPMNYGDANADGWVDSTDALIILSYDVGMTVPFPVAEAAVMPVLTQQPPGCSS
jgi:hypothetical protein